MGSIQSAINRFFPRLASWLSLLFFYSFFCRGVLDFTSNNELMPSALLTSEMTEWMYTIVKPMIHRKETQTPIEAPDMTGTPNPIASMAPAMYSGVQKGTLGGNGVLVTVATSILSTNTEP
eukprot:Trichotokara_eunicae@DN3713_c0_g1_i3.p2